MADTYDLNVINTVLARYLAQGHFDLARAYFANMQAKGAPVQWPAGYEWLGGQPATVVMEPAPPAPAASPQPVYTPPPPPPPQPPRPPAGPTPDQRNALEYARSLFPWLDQLGITANLQEWVVQGLGPEALVAEVRRTPQYEAIFQGIRRPDGTLRKTEAQYLQDNEAYRQVLRTFGRPDYEYDRPDDLRAFHEMEMRPDELEQRFRVYDEVTRGGSDVRDAFYVYAGMRLSDDDLYQMAVNPTFREAKQREYAVRSTISPPDYATFIQRATEAGLERAAATLTELQRSGVAAAEAVTTLQSINPEDARALADALARVDTDGNPRVLALNELVQGLQFALIGGAATYQGLQLPTAERVAAFRQAGIDRARALEGYAQIARQGETLRGALRRAGLAQTFSQQDFEDALFLSSARETDLLQRAQSAERALGQRVGGPAFGSSQRTGLLQQRGFSPLG